jgi:hypothetical protein
MSYRSQRVPDALSLFKWHHFTYLQGRMCHKFWDVVQTARLVMPLDHHLGLESLSP